MGIFNKNRDVCLPWKMAGKLASQKKTALPRFFLALLLFYAAH